jgi:hypothetical protein
MSLKTMRAFSTRLCQSLFAFHNLILYSDVMISVLASSVVDRGLEPRSCGRSWIGTPIGSNQRLYNRYLLFLLYVCI